MAHDRLTSATRRGLCILAACGAALALAGCGQGDPANDAVQRAALEINTLSLGGTNPMPAVDLRVTAYRRIVSELQPHTTAGTPATASAANMLVARAHAGLAAVDVDAVADAEMRALDLVNSVRLQFDRYITEQAQVASLEGYDPASHLADLDNQIKDKDAEIAKAWGEKTALDKVLADLEAQAAAASALATQERQKETALRQQAISAKAVEQAELISKANEHKRTADGHDKEASLLRAQAAQRAPEGGTLQAEIDRLTDQRTLLEDAKAEIRAFAKSNTDRATAGRAEAMAAAERIGQAAGELAKLRGEIPALAEKAVDAYDKAIRAAKAAGQGGAARAEAALTEAINKHAKADLLSLRVRGLRTYAELLGAMSGATPALPDGAAYRTQAEAAAAEADKLTAEAKELLTEAQEAYDSAGGRGEAAERFKRLAASMAALTGKSVAEPPAEPTEEPAETATATEAPAADPEAEVRAMLSEFVTAAEAGDASAFETYMDLSDPAIRAMIDASMALDAACREKFGKSVNDLAKEIMGGQGSPGMTVISAETLDQFQLTVESPELVRVDSPTGLPPGVKVSVVKVDGRWKYKMEYPPQIAKVFNDFAGAFSAVAEEVRSGAVTTSQEMFMSLGRRMMQMQQPPQGGG